MVLMTVAGLLAASISESVPGPWFVTHTRDPSGLTAIPVGPLKPVMVLTTPVATLIFETDTSPRLATHTCNPSGLTTTPAGAVPTVIVLMTAGGLLVASISETLLLLLFVTHTRRPSGLTATPRGPDNPVTVTTAVLEGGTACEMSERSTTPIADATKTASAENDRACDLRVIISTPS
jgi:hypothetical protein